MNFTFKPFFFACLLLLCFQSQAQQLDHVLGQVLIQTEKEMDVDRLLAQYPTFHQRKTGLHKVRTIQSIGPVHLLQFDQNSIHEAAFLRELRSNPLVLTAQYNHLLETRQSLPNDPSVGDQWFWVTNGMVTGAIDADLAWDISTGGMTPDGKEIVVAVIDDGIDVDHPDLQNSLWVNSNEIANNGVDDDGNGYIDDYRGWNIEEDNDDIQTNPAGDGHGVTVAGMVGAIGNNSIGITGVNWSTHLMVVKNDGGVTQAIALEAYAYPYTMRKLYNETNGAKGAFVVASNASWGLNFGQAADAPIWCNFYDSLGQVGIINCAATTNLTVNVDNDGDLPTTCPSDYLIAVTRTGEMQEQGGGFGPVNIDLGAPGINIYSTEKNGTYGFSTGTSLSAPLVAGMVAFLYSIPNNQLVGLAEADPAAAALLSKAYILDGVKIANGYDDLVFSGGIANLFNSAQKVEEDAGACLPPFGLKVSSRTDMQMTLEWTPGNNTVSTELRWRLFGASTWTEEGIVSPPFTVSGLSACTKYEFQVASNCSGATSPYSETKVFSSDGCCTAPENISLPDISETDALVTWSGVFAAQSYDLEIRDIGTTNNWTTFTTTDNFYELSDLQACSNYELRIKTNCQNLNSDYSPILPFNTLGCGECQDVPYCEVERSTEFEYIDRVVFAGVDNESGDNGGYADFFSLPMVVEAGESYEISLTPGYPGFNYTEDFEVWIDYNKDGDFSDPGEDVLFLENTSQTISGNISIPDGLISGTTRMRITIYFMGPSDPCTPQQDGETEDYCITILGDTNDCTSPEGLSVNVIDNYAVFLSWNAVDLAEEYEVSWREFGTTDWQQTTATDNSLLLSNLTFCTEYDVRVRSSCAASNSPFSNSIDFKTKCETSTTDDPLSAFSFHLYPNPFYQDLWLATDSPSRESFSAELYDVHGALVKSFAAFEIPAGAQNIALTDIGALPAGVYFFHLRSGAFAGLRRLVKMQ